MFDSDNTGSTRRASILAYTAIFALVGLITLLFFKGDSIPEAGKDLLLILSGTLVAIVKDVYSYEFGSTRASKQKDQTIANITAKD